MFQSSIIIVSGVVINEINAPNPLLKNRIHERRTINNIAKAITKLYDEMKAPREVLAIYQ